MKCTTIYVQSGRCSIVQLQNKGQGLTVCDMINIRGITVREIVNIQGLTVCEIVNIQQLITCCGQDFSFKHI